MWKGYYQNSCYWMSEVLANPSHDNFAKLERHQIIEYIVASIEVLQQFVLKNNHLVSRHLGRVSVSWLDRKIHTSAEPSLKQKTNSESDVWVSELSRTLGGNRTVMRRNHHNVLI